MPAIRLCRGHAITNFPIGSYDIPSIVEGTQYTQGQTANNLAQALSSPALTISNTPEPLAIAKPVSKHCPNR